jgi:plasmid stabilization system protein ParE
MAYRIRWSPRAADDLEAIAEYISHDSPAYAKSVVKTIVEITRKFSQFPLAGRIVPEFNDEIFVNGSLSAIKSSIELTKTSLPSLR